MVAKNLGLSLSISVWTYLLLTLFIGERGVTAYTMLTDYRDDLSLHIEQLAELQQELAAAATRLQSDPEQIRIEARRMGYVGPSEGLIRITGRGAAGQVAESPGEKLNVPKRWSVERSLLRALALTVALVTFFLLQTMRRDSR